MTRNNYTIKSRRTEDGEITHSYSGWINVNACVDDPHMEPLERKSGLNTIILKFHENYLKRAGEEVITTKVVGKKIGFTPLKRCLNKLAYIIEN